MYKLKTSQNNQPHVIVRTAQKTDVPELATTIVDCFYDFPKLFNWINPLLKLTICEDLRYRLNNSSLLYRCLVATKGSDIAGTVEVSLRSSWWSINSYYPYISNLAVKDNYRRQGVGSQLLTQCEQVSRDWGYRELRLHVLANNYAAKQLYLNMGYRIIQKEENWGKLFINESPRLLMKKDLF